MALEGLLNTFDRENDQIQPQIEKPFMGGLQAGIEFAQNQEKLKILKQEQQNRDDELTIKKQDYTLNYLASIKKASPTVKKALIDQLPKVWERSFGEPPGEAFISLLKADTDTQNQLGDLQSILNSPEVTPAMRLQASDILVKMGKASDIPEAMKTIESAMEAADKLKNTSVAFGGKLNIQNRASLSKSIGELTKKASDIGVGDPGKISYLRDITHYADDPVTYNLYASELQNAVNQKSGSISTANLNKTLETTSQIKQKTTYLTDPDEISALRGDLGPTAQKMASEKNDALAAKINVRTKEASIEKKQSDIQHQRVMEKLAADNLKLKGQQVGLRIQSKDLRVQNSILNHPNVRDLTTTEGAANRVGTLLDKIEKGTFSQVDYEELKLATSHMLTGGKVIPEGRAQALGFNDFEDWVKKNVGSKVSGKEPIKDSDLARQGRDRWERIKNEIVQQRANLIHDLTATSVNLNVIDPVKGQLILDSNVPGTKLDLKQGKFQGDAAPFDVSKFGSTVGNSPGNGAKLSKKDKLKIRSQAANALQLYLANPSQYPNLSPQAIKNKYKQKTGEDF